MIASAEGVIFALLLGPAVLYLLWRWAVFSANLQAAKPRAAPRPGWRQQFNEDSPSYRSDQGPG
jgi:hypothetical protein